MMRSTRDNRRFRESLRGTPNPERIDDLETAFDFRGPHPNVHTGTDATSAAADIGETVGFLDPQVGAQTPTLVQNTAGERPTLDRSSSGRVGLSFDGIDDALFGSGSSWTDVTNDRTVVESWRVNDNTGAQDLLHSWTTPNDTGWYYRADPGADIVHIHDDPGGQVFSEVLNANAAQDVDHVSAWVQDSVNGLTARQFEAEGGAITSDTVGTATGACAASSSLYLGNRGGGAGADLDGWFFCAAIYSRVLTDDELAVIERWARRM